MSPAQHQTCPDKSHKTKSILKNHLATLTPLRRPLRASNPPVSVLVTHFWKLRMCSFPMNSAPKGGRETQEIKVSGPSLDLLSPHSSEQTAGTMPLELGGQCLPQGGLSGAFFGALPSFQGLTWDGKGAPVHTACLAGLLLGRWEAGSLQVSSSLLVARDGAQAPLHTGSRVLHPKPPR